MKEIRAFLAVLAASAILLLGVPAAPAQANGAASTRNLLLLGGAAATYLIVQHNRKVHAQEAENAQRQAAAEEASNDAWSAYHQAEHAYQEELVVNGELQKELAYQHRVVTAQRAELAALSVHDSQGTGGATVISYGWGTL